MDVNQMIEEQILLRDNISINDVYIKYIIGLDISFSTVSDNKAVVCGVLFEYPSLVKIKSYDAVVELQMDYISGLLGFREIPHFMHILNEFEVNYPSIMENKQDILLMVDGNGLWHPRLFGSASHIGVISGYPSVGISKKRVFFSDPTFPRDDPFVEVGEWRPIYLQKTTDNPFGEVPLSLKDIIDGVCPVAAVMRPSQSMHYQYVSVGHQISLNTAMTIIKTCCLNRTPEPIRQADLHSREVIRSLEQGKIVS